MITITLKFEDGATYSHPVKNEANRPLTVNVGLWKAPFIDTGDGSQLVRLTEEWRLNSHLVEYHLILKHGDVVEIDVTDSSTPSRGIYNFSWDCGRMGIVEATLVASQKDIKESIGKSVYFGEILGKHSEVYGTLSEEDFTLLVTDPKIVSIFEENNFATGYNPFDYLEEEE